MVKASLLLFSIFCAHYLMAVNGSTGLSSKCRTQGNNGIESASASQLCGSTPVYRPLLTEWLVPATLSLDLGGDRRNWVVECEHRPGAIERRFQSGLSPPAPAV